MERIVDANGMKIWSETFGEESDPAVLLIMGVGTQGIGFGADFCELLAAAGRYVIRYDHRDTGKSSLVDFDAAPYSLADLAEDAVGLLAALGIERAHLVGVSMGGMVAQEITLNHPDRVLTLTSVISSPSGFDVETMGYTGGLPMMEDRAMEHLMEVAMEEPPSTPEEHVAAFIKLARLMTGSLEPLDEEEAAATKLLELERAVDLDKAMNHNLAMMRSGDRVARLASVAVPTLVIHGDEDPVLPKEHGIATAEAIPGAKLVLVHGLGHTPPPKAQFAKLIVEHTQGVVAK